MSGLSSDNHLDGYPSAHVGDIRPLSDAVAMGAGIGSVVGLLDAFDTILGGFAGPLGRLGITMFTLVCIAVQTAFGALVGLVCGAVFRWLHARGAVWDPKLGFRFGRIRLRPSGLIAAVGVTLMVFLGAALPYFLGSYPYGFDFSWLAALVGPGFCIFLVVSTRLAQRHVAPAVISWLVIGAGFYFLEARVVYQFSKQGLIYIAHTLGLLLLYVVLLTAVGALTSRWRRTLAPMATRTFAVILGSSVILLLTVRPLARLSSNQLRLTLHERTSLTYRVLELLPRFRVSVEDAMEDAGCDRTSPFALTSKPPIDEQSPPVRGVLMIMIDSVRADRVFGYERDNKPLTPRLLELANRGIAFTRAYTTSPSTRRALRSMMTGIYNAGTGMELADERSLGTVLAGHNIKTVALSAHKNVWKSVHNFDVYRVFEKGISNRSSITSHRTVEAVQQELDKIGPDERFFILAHFYDPHAHYVVNSMFNFGRTEKQRYDAEIAYSDYWIGQLLDDLTRRGMDDDVAVLFVSDHGDEFWEHRYRRHLLRSYEESIRVPLIMRVPGAQASQMIDMPVSVADVAPTVLDLIGIEIPDHVEGRSLVPAAQGKPLTERPIFVQQYYDDASAAVQDDKKVIVDFSIGVTEYYDLIADPGEQNNLADARPEAFRPLHCALLHWVDEND